MGGDSQAPSFDDQVYTRLWINHVKGSTYGATLTLSRQAGNFLIAFLALYVSVTGQEFWTISRFFLHKRLSSESQSDGLYHQQQAILRNAESAPSAVRHTFSLTIAWRNRSTRVFYRLLPIWTTAILISAAFGVAGIFSSQVTANQSNEVLLRGLACGTPLVREEDARTADGGKKRSEASLDNLNYAFGCYQNAQQTQSSCQVYTKSKLLYKVDRNATCPFASDLCQNLDDNIYLDSGYLDSWGDLGINTEPRFQIRLTQHCAPLITDRYKSEYSDPADSSKRYMRYSYLRNDTISNSVDDAMTRGVVLVPLKSEFDKVARVFSDNIARDYRTSSRPVNWIDTSIFVPELNRSDAYVSLLFLDSTDILHRKKTEDPWFAHTVNASQWQYEYTGLETLYVPDEPATVVGCASQVYYCNPKIADASRRCVNLYVSQVSDEGFAQIWPEPSDLKAFNGYIETNNVMITTPDIFYKLPGLPNLLARLTVSGGIQWDNLSREHWKDEMEFLGQASLASFQANVPRATRNGVWLLNQTQCVDGNDTSLCEKLCRNQKVRSSDYYSFNVLGMAIIIFVGFFIMLLGAFIETIAAGISDTFNRGKEAHPPYSRLEWNSNSFLDLQRLAHEALGLGTWSRSKTGVPITAAGEMLGALDITGQPGLPVLKRPTREIELKDKEGTSDHHQIELESLITDTRSLLIHPAGEIIDTGISLQGPYTDDGISSSTLRRQAY